jgi:hypothetical protein
MESEPVSETKSLFEFDILKHKQCIMSKGSTQHIIKLSLTKFVDGRM